jgi:hypothetical protein
MEYGRTRMAIILISGMCGVDPKGYEGEGDPLEWAAHGKAWLVVTALAGIYPAFAIRLLSATTSAAVNGSGESAGTGKEPTTIPIPVIYSGQLENRFSIKVMEFIDFAVRQTTMRQHMYTVCKVQRMWKLPDFVVNKKIPNKFIDFLYIPHVLHELYNRIVEKLDLSSADKLNKLNTLSPSVHLPSKRVY